MARPNGELGREQRAGCRLGFASFGLGDVWIGFLAHGSGAESREFGVWLWATVEESQDFENLGMTCRDDFPVISLVWLRDDI